MLRRILPPLLAALLATSGQTRAATADEDWAQITALDAGPGAQPRNADEARSAAVAHLDRQEAALRKFLAAHADDARIFEAKLRLARLLQIRADVQGSTKAVAESAKILDALEKVATPEQRAEVDFTRVTALMRTLRLKEPAQREQLATAARKFQRDHPDDRRIAALFAEVASVFVLQPKTMRAFLADADARAKSPELKSRIADDLRRLDMLGQPLELKFTALDGSAFDVEQLRGKIVVAVFFAAWSPESLATLESMKRTAEGSKDTVALVGVSLDTKPDRLAAILKTKGITAPVGCDGKGWESPLVRALAINQMPTVWLIDKRGRLRSLDGSEETAGQIHQLLGER